MPALTPPHIPPGSFGLLSCENASAYFIGGRLRTEKMKCRTPREPVAHYSGSRIAVLRSLDAKWRFPQENAIFHRAT
jgi:hypothetical protein